jgi:hypothetical protein
MSDSHRANTLVPVKDASSIVTDTIHRKIKPHKATQKSPGSKSVVKRKRGRKSKYSPEIAKIICKGIVAVKLLSKICEAVGINVDTLYAWKEKHNEFSDMYARARAMQAEKWEERILQVAGDTSSDDLFTEDGRRVQNSEWINRSRLKVDALKWLMSKRLPKKYGDKIEVDNKGEVALTIKVVKFSDQGKIEE